MRDKNARAMGGEREGQVQKGSIESEGCECRKWDKFQK